MFNKTSFLDEVISSQYAEYLGVNNDIKKTFNLTHKGLPIFERIFESENPNIVKIDSDIITIPDHFYVTGEEITYSYIDDGISQPIGIAETSIPGIGITDKLPSTLYVVKVNDLDIRVASSSSDALKEIPIFLNITSTGIGTHSFVSKKQNNKVIISIDNVIQSPLVSTSSTTILSKNVGYFSTKIFVDNPNLFLNGDLIKINDEIMRITSIGVGNTNSISIRRNLLGTNLSTHYSSNLVTKIFGNYNIVNNSIYFSDPTYGDVPFTNQFDRGDEVDYSGFSNGSSFSGRVFLRSGVPNTASEPYEKNYIFDDVSDQFDGSQKSFTLKSNNSNITGISTDKSILLINSILQTTGHDSNYNLNESIGITTVTFTGNKQSVDYDVNTAGIPRGGIIVSVGSTQGFGYQPLISAGGTAIVSSAGTIQSISIGNSGSGYRVGIQTIVNVGVKTEDIESSRIEFIGTAAISNGGVVSVAITNPGIGYTSSNPPIVVFDYPLSYSNIPLVYSSQSQIGVGSGAAVDIVVGQGSSVISFELKNLGYGYKLNDILTISAGGTTGIQTTLGNFSEFQIFVNETHIDKFSSWSIGNLLVFDSIENLFDGRRTSFPLSINNSRTAIVTKKGSKIDIQATLLILVNDVLQIPGSAYIFNGGSIIRFTEAPKQGDKAKIIFYGGTKDIDTVFVDILESIKVGDTVTLKDDDFNLLQDFNEDERSVVEIISPDAINTNLYPGPGIVEDENFFRSLTWCKQTEDLVINNVAIGKDRIIYEPYIQPSTNIIQNIGVSTTEIFVESVKSFFDSELEYVHDGSTEKPQNKIIIISQDTIISAAATAIVSTSGTISSISITNPGMGYITPPSISIGNPIGIGTSGQSSAVAAIIDGSISSIGIVTGGFGYDPSHPPMILIESPQTKYEVIDGISYEGDFGIIVGVQTTSVGLASTGIVFDFFIPENSFLRDGETVKDGTAITGFSGIQTGYYFTVNNSNIGMGLTSLNSSGDVVGIGTSFIDNIYQAVSVSIAQTAVPGSGIVNVAKVTVSVNNYNGLSGFGFSSFYGEYSWGKITVPTRRSPQEFFTYANVGGISTSPIVQRYNRLKFIGYSNS